MSIIKFTSRDFNHNPSKVKHASKHDTVVITERGTPKYVMMSIETYQQLTQANTSIIDMLAMPDDYDVEFDKLPSILIKPVEFD